MVEAKKCEKIPINELVVEQEPLRIRQILKPTQGRAQYYSLCRDVQQIIVEENGLSSNICQESPVGTQFQTAGWITGTFSKFDSGVPSASCFKGEDGNPVVEYNPKILDLRGGVLTIFHEEGHAWQQIEGRFSGRPIAGEILENFNLDQAKRAEIIWAVTLIDQQENDAWDFAIEKYWNYRKRGLNVAPRISEEELNSYPQHWLDMLNRRYWQVADFLGRDKLFVRRT